MSVKSKIKLTRDEAERKYVDLIMKHGNPEYFLWNRECVHDYDDQELESNLEEMNDIATVGKGFENYRIVREDQE